MSESVAEKVYDIFYRLGALIEVGASQIMDNLCKLEAELKEQAAEIEKLNRICTVRGERMQIMREFMVTITGSIHEDVWSQWRMFLAHNGNAADWFNEHGIPQENSDEFGI